MRAIDVHVHPMDEAYVEASGPFIPAANRMFNGKFSARPDAQIAEDFRRDDALAIPIAWDAENGAAGSGLFQREASGTDPRLPGCLPAGLGDGRSVAGPQGAGRDRTRDQGPWPVGGEVPAAGAGVFAERQAILSDMGIFCSRSARRC